MRKSDISKAEVSAESAVCSTKKCGGLWHKFMWLIVIVVLVVAGYYGWGAIKGLKPGLNLSAGQGETTGVNDQVAQVAAQKEIMAIVEKVKRLMILPDNELPQMAEIRDAALAAKEQPFYTGAQNGDKILVYLTTRKAIIYSPARDLIVNVGPVYMDEPKTTSPNPTTASTTKTTTKKK